MLLFVVHTSADMRVGIGDGARIRPGSHGGWPDGRAVRLRAAWRTQTRAVIVRDDVPLVDELGRVMLPGSLDHAALSGGSGPREAAGPRVIRWPCRGCPCGCSLPMRA